jgi:hypothetical protein
MQLSIVFSGSALTDELRSSDRMEAKAARAWISRKSGRDYASEAMYELRWHDDEDSPTWDGYVGLEVRVMNDRDLLDLEREHRKRHGMPERKPWEAPMYKVAMGFSDAPRRER